MVHLDNKDKYKQNSSHEQLISTHDEQITRLLLQVQNLAIRLDEVEQLLADHMTKKGLHVCKYIDERIDNLVRWNSLIGDDS